MNDDAQGAVICICLELMDMRDLGKREQSQQQEAKARRNRGPAGGLDGGVPVWLKRAQKLKYPLVPKGYTAVGCGAMGCGGTGREDLRLNGGLRANRLDCGSSKMCCR